ncbi:hypothetical protein [Kribbella antiqua]|uniref:hypothetical protein n=1 Tax=Kribbella antiqua TaxID=2512217 RepID=UPI001F541563|nr:hypothetical protein [Kribbella antiqua]
MAVVDTAVVDADQDPAGAVGDLVCLVRFDLDHVPLLTLARIRRRGCLGVVDRRRTGWAFADGSGAGGADGFDLAAVVAGADVGAEVGVGRLRDHDAELGVRLHDRATGRLHRLLDLAHMPRRRLRVHHVVHQRPRHSVFSRYGVSRRGAE